MPLTETVLPINLVRRVGGVWVIDANHMSGMVEARHGRGVARRGWQIGRVDVFPCIRHREIG